jgi:hypothetical protein
MTMWRVFASGYCTARLQATRRPAFGSSAQKTLAVPHRSYSLSRRASWSGLAGEEVPRRRESGPFPSHVWGQSGVSVAVSAVGRGFAAHPLGTMADLPNRLRSGWATLEIRSAPVRALDVRRHNS